MTSTARNTLIIIVVVIVIIALFFAFHGNSGPSAMTGAQTSTSTADVNGTGSTGANGTVSGAGATITASTALVNNTNALNNLLDTALVRVPNTGTDVALSQGSSDFTSGSVKGHVTRGPIIGKIATNDGYDVYTDMSITTVTSSSTIHYVALFQVMGSAISYTSSVVVGDRLAIQNVTAKADANATVNAPQVVMNSQTGYILTINYLDRKNGQAMTIAPSVAKALDVHVKGHIVSR